MKRATALIFAVLMSVFLSVTASAKSVTHKISKVSFTLNDDFSVFTVDDLAENSSVDGLLFAAISSDGTQQIQVRRTETRFSSELGTFSGLTEETVKPVGERLFPDGYSVSDFGTNTYLKQSTVSSDGNISVIYVTVSEKMLYTFTYFGSDPTVIGEFMASVTLPASDNFGGIDIVMIVILSVLVIAAASLSVIIVMSFIKDYRRRKMERSENIVSNYIKIKRRKY